MSQSFVNFCTMSSLCEGWQRCCIHHLCKCDGSIFRRLWTKVHKIQRIRFPIETRPFRARDTILGNFCDDNVCACAVSILILLPVINIAPKWIQRHRFRTWRGIFSRPKLFFASYFDIFSLRMRSFHHITTSSLKSDVIFEFREVVFL